jgi:hypothetical protein
MNLETFLSLILPDDGFRFLIRDAKVHTAYKNNKDTAKAAAAMDAKGYNVYFACASYKESQYFDEVKQKTRYRTQENALAAKALWLDLDVGEGKDYVSQSEALDAVAAFCNSTDFPLPLRVSSGNGVHCYWPLESALPTEAWEKITQNMRPIYEAAGLRFDHSRDCDIASILRPVGTNNRKDKANPKRVDVIAQHDKVLPIAELIQFIQANKTAKPAYLQGAKLNDDLSLPKAEYAPMDAEVLAEGCAQIRFFRDTGGGGYNAWRANIGMLKHCENGEIIAHQWGSQYAGYDEEETQEKLDDWNTPPPTCAAYGNDNGLCTGCAHNGKIKSPVALAVKSNPSTIEIEVAGDDEDDPVKVITLELPKGYAVDEFKHLCYFVNVATKTKDNQTPKPIWELKPFCNTLFYPVDRIEDTDGIMSTRWRAEYDFMGRRAAREFTVPNKLIGERGAALHGLLGQYEIVVPSGNKRILEEYMASFLTKLRAEREAIRQYKTYGWQVGKDGIEGFLLGDTMETLAGPRKVLAGSKNMSRYAEAFQLPSGGSATRWGELINAMYNHPKHEQFQFVVYAGFGSALVQFLGEDTGAPICLYGGKGQGKTTAAKMALGVYGRPDKLMLTWKSGTTLNAALISCATMRSVPFLFDEFSNAGSELSDVLYALGNGRDKARADTSGNLRMEGSTWRNVNFLTTNHSLHDKVAMSKDDASAEISRMLEIHWENTSSLDQATMQKYLREMEQHYGAPYKVFMPWVIQNMATVMQIIDKIKSHLDSQVGFSKEYRFWSLQLAAVLAGGFIANKLGLTSFDWKAVERYAVALGRLHMFRIARQVTPAIESFHAMITAYSNQIISTKEEGDGRSSAIEVRSVGEPVGRLITSKGVLYFAVGTVREWCKERHINIDDLRMAVEAAGIMEPDSQERYYIGRGTTLVTGQVYCWKLNWNLIVGTSADVVPIKQLVSI